jgi:hypothetical protein
MLDALIEVVRDIVLATIWLGTEVFAVGVGSALGLTGIMTLLRRQPAAHGADRIVPAPPAAPDWPPQTGRLDPLARGSRVA